MAQVDHSELSRRVTLVRRLMSSHFGAIDVTDVSSGTVKVRFTGMCVACPLRPMTLAATIRPALLEVAGVERVEMVGGRLSEEAEARLAGLTQTKWTKSLMATDSDRAAVDFRRSD
jgi:Fe-S cluster biogenesis protein NfuA